MAITIEFSKKADKELMKAPSVIREAINSWIWSVREIGWLATCKQGGNGLHDEPLQGNRAGQRSIRLSRSWRLIYTIEQGHIIILSITKHDYR